MFSRSEATEWPEHRSGVCWFGVTCFSPAQFVAAVAVIVMILMR